MPRTDSLNDLTKNILLWVIIAVVLLTVFSNSSPRSGESREMPYSTFLQQVKAKNIASAVIKERDHRRDQE